MVEGKTCSEENLSDLWPHISHIFLPHVYLTAAVEEGFSQYRVASLIIYQHSTTSKEQWSLKMGSDLNYSWEQNWFETIFSQNNSNNFPPILLFSQGIISKFEIFIFVNWERTIGKSRCPSISWLVDKVKLLKIFNSIIKQSELSFSSGIMP